MINIEADIEVVESGYEFLLAYAAQGRAPQDESGPGPHPRPELEKMLAAMTNAKTALAQSVDEFEQVIVDDLKKASAAVKFVLSQPKLGSEVIDNLNASIHLRAVLTDFFLYSEAFRPNTEQPSPEPQSPGWDKIGN
ncbi:MAG: hypothetical protein R3332_07235 [Pseudohongiellaceae bacterium]|nr:hypothetical protein [Pseudohongiellaceae bacterium]